MSLQARITATANPFAAISATFGGSISLSEARTAVFNTSATQRWVDGQLSNFEYLMHLNSLAGRSHNDLTQYPVFPWILSDYTSESIDLNDESVYRDLSKPMGALGAARAKEFQNRFEHWDDPNTPPFHYGTHYSSAGGVLSYLIRMEPYTRYALELQRFVHFVCFYVWCLVWLVISFILQWQIRSR
jgi:hypothetical protein